MTITQIEQREDRLFSYNGFIKDREQWGDYFTTSRELTTLEDLLEPWRLQ